jgi:aspartyl-tRNA(Asn)/glutamyl-tRNA(Gln) amidotransferase subunit B
VNAIEYEINRQIEVLSSGQLVENETRSFDPAAKMTLTMRDKEAKQDYR